MGLVAVACIKFLSKWIVENRYWISREKSVDIQGSQVVYNRISILYDSRYVGV
jgi:hypothetical protein